MTGAPSGEETPNTLDTRAATELPKSILHVGILGLSSSVFDKTSGLLWGKAPRSMHQAPPENSPPRGVNVMSASKPTQWPLFCLPPVKPCRTRGFRMNLERVDITMEVKADPFPPPKGGHHLTRTTGRN